MEKITKSDLEQVLKLFNDIMGTEEDKSFGDALTSLFNMDDVELEFTDDALNAIAEKTLEKKTGARGLRGIMENVLMPIMYDTPSEHTIAKVIITRECVVDGASPEIIRDEGRKPNILTSKSIGRAI